MKCGIHRWLQSNELLEEELRVEEQVAEDSAVVVVPWKAQWLPGRSAVDTI